MKDLGKWQIISFVSRGTATALGLVQSAIILRILTVSEWGLVQLAVSIGGALGIYQHLGLVSASTREVSSAKDDNEIFHVFITSSVIRYIVSIPIAIGLFVFSKHIAGNLYSNLDLIVPLKIYALILLIQAVQGIINSVVAGNQKFKYLFSFQIGVAFLSVLIYVPMIYFYKVNGYFYAFLLHTLVSTVILGYLGFKDLKITRFYPTKKEFVVLFKQLFSISMAIYLVKIIYTNWEKAGGNLLGLFNSTEIVGVFSFAMLYAKKLLNISDSVTDVNLPVFSDKFVHDLEGFKTLFSKNFDKIFVFVNLVALTAMFWSKEIVYVWSGGNNYDASILLIPAIMLAFILYSFINIINSSVLIPAKMQKEMIFSYFLMILGTALFYILGRDILTDLPAMAWGMAFGTILGLLSAITTIYKGIKFSFFNHDHALIIIQAFVTGYAGIYSNLLTKTIAFPIFTLLFIWAALTAKFVTMDEIKDIVNKIKKNK